MRNVVFLVKNGIGFGHIRRALLLADAVATAGQVRPVVISQASSLALYQNSRVPVINFPLLHRVPSAITEDCYTDILDELLHRLDPAVAIEDTYPDPRYGRLASLREVPRLLVMRRLDGTSFDQLRTQGGFVRYNKILTLQTPAEFAAEEHSGDSMAAATCSGRFSFVGNISVTPGPDEIEAARVRYAPAGEPLVVVSAGAGGDQMPDGYGDRLFTACQQIATRLHTEGHPAQFVLVTGPYYAGRPLAPTPQVAIRRFEPHLAALLAAADVAVLKPGNNALSEALLGNARLILVPDVSFMEGLDEHARRIIAHYGGVVTRPAIEELEPAVRAALTQPARSKRTAPNRAGVAEIVDTIHRHVHCGVLPPVPAKQLALIIAPPAGLDLDTTQTLLPAALERAAIVGDTVIRLSHPNACAWTPVMLADIDPPANQTPQDLVNAGVRLLLTFGPQPGATLRRWLDLAPPRPTLLTSHAHRLRATIGRIDEFARRITMQLTDQAHACMLLDLTALTETAAKDYLDAVGAWLTAQPVRLITPDMLTMPLTRALLGTTP